MPPGKPRHKKVDFGGRVQGCLQAAIPGTAPSYKGGATLCTIEPENYKLKLAQAQADEAGAKA